MRQDPYDFEEEYHSQDRKQSRKERKHLQESDRSKFKKTDIAKLAATPTDPSLPRGQVVSIGGEGLWVESEGKRFLCALKGGLKKETTQMKNLVAVGDFVRFEPLSEKEGSVAHIEPRISVLTRTEIRGKKEQLIAANVDQLLIIVSLFEPPLKPALVDRYLIAAAKGNIHPIIVINKVDLLHLNSDEEARYREFLAAYEPLGFPILTLSAKTGSGIEALRSLMQGKTSVLSGQSGVGKSSLLNAAFNFSFKTGELAQKTAKGAHTTTTASLVPLPQGGYCVDTPGIRSFGLWNLQKEEVFAHFQDLAKLGKKCRFLDCSHREEPDCAVLKALRKGKFPSMRYESFQALLDEATSSLDNRTKKLLENDEG